MADFNTLKAAIRAAIYENTEQAITGDALQGILLEMVTDINTAKQDALTLVAPLEFNSNGALMLNYSGHGITLDADGNLGVEAGFGLGFVDSTLVVNYGSGLTIDEDTDRLVAYIGEGLEFVGGAVVPDFQFVQAAISDLATIRSGAAAGATAVQPADVSDCVRSTTIRTMVTLTQAEYDALANKDANTFYIII